MSVKVVSNTSPLIFLAKLDALELLTCFTSVRIPGAVLAELQGLSLPPFIQHTALSEALKREALAQLGPLHLGELEAVALARSEHADFVLMDDAKAWAYATSKAVKPMGVMGVLLYANKKGMLSQMQGLGYLRDLKEKHGLYVSDALLSQLEEAFV